jgi:hypothetical protein
MARVCCPAVTISGKVAMLDREDFQPDQREASGLSEGTAVDVDDIANPFRSIPGFALAVESTPLV